MAKRLRNKILKQKNKKCLKPKNNNKESNGKRKKKRDMNASRWLKKL